MKRSVLIFLVLGIALIPGWADRCETQYPVICGEIVWELMSDCGEYVDMWTCDEQLVCVHVSLILDLRCSSGGLIKIFNPEMEYNANLNEYCIIDCDSVECIYSCDECQMEQCKGRLYVSCNEGGYDLYLNGIYILTEDGDGECSVDLEEGRYTVKLEKGGCDSVTTTVDIFCEYASQVNLEMNCDPCRDVVCDSHCIDDDLWAFKCIDGECVQDYIKKGNAEECGYNRCENVTCKDGCIDEDLWAFKCIEGECVQDYIVERNAEQCGYNPCEGHCYNGKLDCGEDDVDCGGDCSRKCPNDNIPLAVVGIGGAVAVGGGIAYHGMKGRRPPTQRSTTRADQPRMRKTGNQRTREVSDQIRTARRLTDQIRTTRADQPQIREYSQEVGEPDQPQMREYSQEIGEPDQPKLTGEHGSTPMSEDTPTLKETVERIAREEAEKVTTKAKKRVIKEATKRVEKKLSEKTKTSTEENNTKEVPKTQSTKIKNTKWEKEAKGVTVGSVLAKKKGVMQCPHCGGESPPGSTFCQDCGFKF